jgi:GT2 family glycosyltransferase
VARLQDVSIVIPTWNGRHLLEEFLPSVEEAARRYAADTGAAADILVVDDGSTDDSVAWLAARAAASPAPLRTLALGHNTGFGAACNRGAAEARAPLLLLLNNDVEMTPDAIAPLARRFGASDPGGSLFAVHSRVADAALGRDVGTGKMAGFSRGFLRVHRSYVTTDPPAGPRYSIFASGGSALFDRASFLELGGFDPIFAPFYFEDVELCYRAWKRGFTVGYEPHSLVRHRFSSTIGPLAGRSVGRISQRNRLLLHWIHLHDARLLAAHVAWLAVVTLTAPLALRGSTTRATFDALGRLGRVRARRREERAAAVRSDRAILGIFRAMAARPDIRVYDDPGELEDGRA